MQYWQVKYIDSNGYETCVEIKAYSKKQARTLFRIHYGYYTIVEIKWLSREKY